MPLGNDDHVKYWLSEEGQSPSGQWAQLTFPVPVTVRNVRIYDLPDPGLNVLDATVRLYGDTGATDEVASAGTGELSDQGTDVPFDDVLVRAVRIEIDSVVGNVTGLAEVEVIARGEAGP